MSSKNQTVKFFSRLFPGISLWLRFPAFISFIAISAGIYLTSRYGNPDQLRFTPHCSLYHIITISAIVSLLCGVIIKNLPIRFSCFFIAGVLFYLINTNDNEFVFDNLKNSSAQDIYLYGKVISPSMPTNKKISFLFTIDSLYPDNKTLHKRVFQCIGNKTVLQGITCRVHGKIKIPGRQNNPYEYDEYNYLLSNGITSQFTIDSVLAINRSLSTADYLSKSIRSGVSKVINEFSDSEQRAILFAAFLGETEFLSNDLKSAFRISGIYHLLSVSGLPAAILLGACYFLLGFLPIPSSWRHYLALSTIWSYQLFIGFVPCLFRATVMATLVIITFLFQKKSYPIQAIGLAGTICLLFSPLSLFQPGYQFSFAATFCIITFYPVLNRFTPQLSNRFLNYITTNILSSFYISIAALASTLPIILYTFGTFSLYGLVANLIAVPSMTIAMWFFFTAILFSILCPPVILIPVFLCKQMLSLLIATADLSLKIPFSTIALPAMSPEDLTTFIVVIICISTINKKYLLTSLGLILPVMLIVFFGGRIYRQMQNTLSITAFHVEKASLYTIKWTDNRIWVFIYSISPGSIPKCLKIIDTWLRHQGESKVDMLFLSSKSQNSITGVQLSKDHPSIIQFNKTGMPIKDSVQIIRKSNSAINSHVDTFTIYNRHDTLYTKINKGEYTVQFPVESEKTAILLQNMSAGLHECLYEPCMVNIKSNSKQITNFKVH